MTKRLCKLAPLAAFAFLLVAGRAAGQDDLGNDTCLACHGMEGFTDADGRSIFVDGAEYAASVHANFPCVGCHSDVTEVPHEHKIKRLDFEACGTCHGDVVAAYAKSIHGVAHSSGDPDAPSCTNCHGAPHGIRKVTNPDSPVYPLTLPRTCGVCHSNPALAARHDIPVADAYQLYMDSIHGRALTRSGLLVAANCSSCHGSHDIQPANNPTSKVYRFNIPATCGTCHAGVEKVYFSGTHGEAVKAGSKTAPVCVDCHTAHRIASVNSLPWKLRIVGECGTCHEESLRTYRDTLHGQVTALGFVAVARCSSCHGYHRVLPPSNPQSMVAPDNLVETCRKCHPRANANFVEFQPHADPENRQRNPGLYYTAQAMHWLIVGVFIFFGAHTTLWFIRSVVKRLWPRLRRPRSDTDA